MGCLVLLPLVEMPYILFIYLDGEAGELLSSFIYCPLTLSDVVQIARERQANAFQQRRLKEQLSL